VIAPGAVSAGAIVTDCDCESSSAVEAGVGADVESDADAVPLVASNAEISPLEVIIAAMTIANASVLTNRWGIIAILGCRV
jgi:hypothetical protein